MTTRVIVRRYGTIAALTSAITTGWLLQEFRPCGRRWYRRAYMHAWNEILSLPRAGGRVQLVEESVAELTAGLEDREGVTV